MTVYLGGAAAEELVRAAQAELNRHLLVLPDGRCVTCGGVEPCPARVRQHATFARLGRLPRRKPGIAGPALPAGDRRTSWFTRAGSSS
jgi:hypothetical protein